ncbi:MAG: Wzz/FepE/Etk N-terminal domain-containing protein [Bacteroidota bacterium]|nr:Wzz/FepE/Etk N-terminal domain-containing protein [Bacteroidota bacterium]
MINLKENGEFDSSGLLFFVYRWRKTLIIVFVMAVIASWIFSSPFFITPKYQSSVIMFPVATNSISKALISQKSGIKEDILGFGEEEQAEQMLQILNSNRIRDRIIAKYDLLNHYDIKPGSKYRMTRLIREYENNITFRRTEYMAVKISVLDKDPIMAADIASSIAELIDSTKNLMQKERAVMALKIVHTEYNELQREINQIVDSLRVLGQLGVHDYESQSEVLNQQLAIAISKNNKQAINALEKKMSVLAEYGSIFLSLKNTLEYKTEQITLLKAKYEEAKVDAEQELPQKFIVNSAYVAEKKSYPVRWMIVVVSTLSALMLAIICIIIMESFTKFLRGSN